MVTGKIILLTAPSGAGKSSIAYYLLENNEWLAFSVSAATRERRKGEIEGVHYYFITPEDFREKVKNNEFLEWEMVYKDNYYGTLRSEIQRIWSEGKTPLLDIDVKGAIHIEQEFPTNTLSIFIEPPSIEVLEERLRKRGTETEEKIRTRMNKAAYEISLKDSFDLVILNDDLDKACIEAEKAVTQFVKQA
ncbi:MAG: guanylate kinase [Chitinophagaceae bacterium]